MNEATAVGIIAILIGLIVCLRGYVALRVIIALLGAWVGFFLGAGLVAGFTDGGFLGATLAWVAAIAGAILLAWLAYAFYQVAVLLGMGALGFAVATGVLAALGVDSPLLLWLIGAAAAVLLVVLALVTDLPAGILIVLTALAGANIAVTGVLLLIGDVTLLQLELGRAPDDIAAWWGIVAIALAVVGIVVQYRGVNRNRTMRAAWSGETAAQR
jgi:hypothetical protein